jgi:hypothetical protein
MLLGRLLLGRLRGIGVRRGRLPLVPTIPGYAELIPGSTEKISRLAVDGNFLATHCSRLCIFARIPGFGAESNEFRVIFPVISVLREFRAADRAGPTSYGSAAPGQAATSPLPAVRQRYSTFLTYWVSSKGKRYCSNPKTRFQSFFMLMTTQSCFVASSYNAWVKVPTLVSGSPCAGP